MPIAQAQSGDSNANGTNGDIPTIGGNVYGGGRMADVTNTTTQDDSLRVVTATVDIYSSNLGKDKDGNLTAGGSIFGGNDISGMVWQDTRNGCYSSKVTIHGLSSRSDTLKLTEVYGGGNGYCDSKGVVYDYKTGVSAGKSKPEIVSTLVQIGDTRDSIDNIYIESVYGGAKNAYVSDTANVRVNRGTIASVFGGNNIGGTVYATTLTINNTKFPSDAETKTNTYSINYDDLSKAGVEYGIHAAYGGGNKVDVRNSVDVVANCGFVRTLFGGNNLADMASAVPTISFGSGYPIYIDTVYGGGNQGDMKGAKGMLTDCSGYLTSKDKFSAYDSTKVPIFVGTDVQVNSSTLFVNSVFGGCRSANVDNSTLIHINVPEKKGYIGNVFGGCDISGTVGKKHGKAWYDFTIKTMYDHSTAAEPVTFKAGADTIDMGTNIILTKGTVATIFGGGNGDYDYSSDAYKDYATKLPVVTSSWVDIRDSVGTVYGGGNAADLADAHVCLYGPATVGTADSLGAVYGGCKRANVTHATNVSMLQNKDKNVPTVNGNVFGGCDISGNVGDCNAVCDVTDADGNSTLDQNVHLSAEPTEATIPGYACVKIAAGKVTGRVFGGGNGLQDAVGVVYYTGKLDTTGLAPLDVYTYPDSSTYAGMQLPVCQNTYVDIDSATIGTIDSTANNEVHTVFGGGQGAGTKVMHNVYTLVGNDSSRTVVNGILYGGSYAGFVNSTCEDITKTILIGYGSGLGDNGNRTQIHGDIYGGSYGNYVRGEISLNIKYVGVGNLEDEAVGIYAGNNNAGQPECVANINYIGNQCNVSLYGGGNMAPFYGTTHLVFTKGDIGYLYGGGNHAPVYGNTIVEVLGGHVCHDVFGGGNEGGVFVNRATDTEHNASGKDYGGNTLVIIRDDCLKLDAEGNFAQDSITSVYQGNYSTSTDDYYSKKYFAGNDPDADNKNFLVLKPNSVTDPVHSEITIDGSVYGGGNQADVDGKTTVIVGDKKE